MDERRWGRIGAAVGVTFLVLTYAATFLYPQQPRVDASPAKTLAWARQNRVGLEVASVFGIFGSALFVWFTGHVRHLLDRVQAGAQVLSHIVFGAGLGIAVMWAIGALPNALMLFLDGQPGGLKDETVVRMLGDLNTLLFAPNCAMLAVFLTAIGIAMMRQMIGTRLLGWIALVAAALNLVGVVISATFDTWHGRAWYGAEWAPFLAFTVVILMLCIELVSRPGTERRATVDT